MIWRKFWSIKYIEKIWANFGHFWVYTSWAIVKIHHLKCSAHIANQILFIMQLGR